MKMKLWDRLILLFGALLNLACGVLLFLRGLQIENYIPYIVFAVLLAAFGVYLVLLLRRCYVKRNEFVIQRTESGELRIAVKAIENQVQKCIDLHEEIQVNTMNILTTREGVVVDLIVTLANNISIPLAVASLQKQIKQYLVASSGIEVKEVRVSVESTQNTVLPAEPAPEGEPAEKAAAKEEKKAPMHQRLFGRADEPAIVPEPPKEECTEDEEAATEAETEEAVAVEEAKDPSVSPWMKPDEEPAADESSEAPETVQTPEEPEAAPAADASEMSETPETPEAPETPSEPLAEAEIIPESEEKTNE
ncbi:MAG: alkaline shock response membrane anchor protein AmaP [Clostridia bacterium]|nr:alkaline shock response membrane anchor protein AmaP [Clostridia bacterium]